MAKSLFELKDVYFSYLGKFPALSGIDLTIHEGAKAAIVGANGTGKSTLLTLLDALIFPSKGSISFFGKELKESDFHDTELSRFFRSKVGFVFQNPDIQLFCPTVKEDIVFGPLQLGIGEEEIHMRLKGMVQRLKIDLLLERSPHELSIGEKRKVAIASVLILKPEVLLLDEPTAGLDPQTTRDIIDILLEENGKGTTIVTATHDMHIVDEISDLVCVFGADKRIVRQGSPRDILSDQEFLQAQNLVHAHRHKHEGVEHVHPHLHGLEHHH